MQIDTRLEPGRFIGPDRILRREMGDSAPGVSARARGRAPHRSAPPPRECIANRSGNNDMRAGAAGRARAGRGAGTRLRDAAAQKQFFHLPLKLREGRVERPAPRIDDNLALWTQFIEPEPNGFTDPPSNSIANDSFAHCAGHGKADLGPLGFRAAREESGKERPRIPGTLIINSSEISGSQNTDTFGKTCDVTTSRS